MTAVADAPIRLAYTLAFVPHSQRVMLLPYHQGDKTPLSEHDVRPLRPKLHALDLAIVTEMLTTTVFSQLSDTQVARLLPVLAQRRTRLGEGRLDVREEEVSPRISVINEGRGVRLYLHLARGDDKKGQPRAPLSASAGRLLVGPQAWFLDGTRAFPLRSRNPAPLAHFSREPSLYVGPERLGAEARDALLRDLTSAGVPEEDLANLAVHRGPPTRIVLRFVEANLGPQALPKRGHVAVSDEPRLTAVLEAEYEQGTVRLGSMGGRNDVGQALISGSAESHADTSSNEAGQDARTEEMVQADLALDAEHQDEADPIDAGAEALTERDQQAETEAIRALRLLGFKSERGVGVFTAQGELALRALDKRAALFDPEWRVERGTFAPVFHRDLALAAKANLVPERGLIAMDVSISAMSDDAQVEALVDMQQLLNWLQSGRRYVRLADGSFAAPSARFKQGLRILRDLGADTNRALISPLCIGLLRAMGDVAALTEVDEATRALMQELVEANRPRHEAVPTGMKVTMRDYQRRGLDWLMLLHRHRLTGILADDMGLGKTVQTLALLLNIKQREGQKPSLVVAPTSVLGVWRDEAERYTPDLVVQLWYGTPQERARITTQGTDLVVTSYGVLRRDAERLSKMAFRYVILDEAQSTKNARSLGAAAIRQVKSERRLALSGTPLENRPEELWSIFDFLAPGFLGSLSKFRRTYALPIARGDRDAMALLRLKIEPLILRRLKSEVAKELPEKVESTMRCEMGSAQRALYDHVAGELKESIKEKIAAVGIEQAQLDILAALTRLRQICCDPALLPAPSGTRTPPSAKLEMFGELMGEALDGGRCVVVFSQFVEMQRRLIEVIKKLGVKPLWLHGGTTNRDRVVQNFQDPEGPPVIVVSLKAGGVGLTLTRADTVVHYDPWWNPAVERQATDRAHRLGQKRTVNVYRLVCTRSIEERVLEMAEAKEIMAQELLGSSGSAAAKRISRDEVLALLS